MGWSIGFDSNWNRDIGYGVPAICDHPDCNEEIDRGLGYVCCEQEPYGGERGCGLYFCEKHRYHWRPDELPEAPEDEDEEESDEGAFTCERCAKHQEPFTPKPDVPEWLRWKLRDASWMKWRQQNPDEVQKIRASLQEHAEKARATQEKKP